MVHVMLTLLRHAHVVCLCVLINYVCAMLGTVTEIGTGTATEIGTETATGTVTEIATEITIGKSGETGRAKGDGVVVVIVVGAESEAVAGRRGTMTGENETTKVNKTCMSVLAYILYFR